MKEIAQAYHASFKKESEYRENEHTIEQTLNDTIITSYNYCGLHTRKFPT